ncbi:unnamed protein product [Phytomonas sp. EM1]|nr:unnamed protein product [Phytomonas sp. EM1]|eukprot:CCW62807.1 unnamed protein product [Phytomonas sp. isolate EM1]
MTVTPGIHSTYVPCITSCIFDCSLSFSYSDSLIQRLHKLLPSLVLSYFRRNSFRSNSCIDPVAHIRNKIINPALFDYSHNNFTSSLA